MGVTWIAVAHISSSRASRRDSEFGRGLQLSNGQTTHKSGSPPYFKPPTTTKFNQKRPTGLQGRVSSAMESLSIYTAYLQAKSR